MGRAHSVRTELGEECLNGCSRRSDGVRVRCRPPRLLCDHCSGTLEGWVEVVPRLWQALGSLVPRGSSLEPAPVGAGRATRGAHAPMPIRTDVVSLLDYRGNESVIWRLNRWTVWLAECRNLSWHLPSWDAPRTDLLSKHLPWLLAQPEVRSFYRDVQSMHRQMRWALGERPPAAVGSCGAQLAEGEVCGGPLLPLRYSVGVGCGWCGDAWQEGDLRGLGNLLDKRWVPIGVAAYVSGRSEATVRDWQNSGALPALCDLGSRQVQVDALALEVLASTRASRKRRTA